MKAEVPFCDAIISLVGSLHTVVLCGSLPGFMRDFWFGWRVGGILMLSDMSLAVEGTNLESVK